MKRVQSILIGIVVAFVLITVLMVFLNNTFLKQFSKRSKSTGNKISSTVRTFINPYTNQPVVVSTTTQTETQEVLAAQDTQTPKDPVVINADNPSEKQEEKQIVYDGSGQNLIQNSSFESVANDEPSAWDITNGLENQYSPVTAPVRSGKKSLKVTPQKAELTLYAKSVQNTSSKAPYTLSVSIYIASRNCETTA